MLSDIKGFDYVITDFAEVVRVLYRHPTQAVGFGRDVKT